MCLSVRLSVCLCVYLSVCCPSVRLPVCQTVCLPDCLSGSQTTYLCLSVRLPLSTGFQFIHHDRNLAECDGRHSANAKQLKNTQTHTHATEALEWAIHRAARTIFQISAWTPVYFWAPPLAARARSPPPYIPQNNEGSNA